MGCHDCLCYYCLRYWQGRDCPYGGCFDDFRAVNDSYINHHPERHLWSLSHAPGEQEHWCRGGSFYPAVDCDHFIEYEGQTIEQCVRANIQVFQDGTRNCCMMVNGSCERCLRELEERKNAANKRKEDL